MHRLALGWIAALLLCLAPPCGAEDTSRIPLAGFPHSTLQVLTPDARIHKFDVWLALDDVHRMQGLMFVRELAEDQGMLFLYPRAQNLGIWMKNTLIPLDIVFINTDGTVQKVAANARPLSLETIPSKGDAIGVLELKGGVAKQLGIAPGAKVVHEAFNNSAKRP